MNRNRARTMMTHLRRLFGLVAVPISIAAVADDVLDRAQDTLPSAQECPRTLPEEPLATEYGSAGIMKNMAETEDSIRAIASRLLEQALTVESTKPAPGCSPDCPDDGVAAVIYRVAPSAFLPRSQQNDVCLRFEDETAANPLRFEPPVFADGGAVNAWISDFSQGRGDHGKRLYEQCSSNCSPRYTFVIGTSDAGYTVEAEVLCGLARDRANDQYLISTALRRSCAAH